MDPVRHTLDELEAAGLRRQLRPLQPAQSARQLHLEGHELLNFASNDYLGLASHPALRASAHEALDRWGVGSRASRLVSGSLTEHHALEADLAKAKGAEACLTFSSGYAVAVGALPALVQRGDTVLLDKLCHASLIDGARLSGATLRVFPHNDLTRLDQILTRLRARHGPQHRILIVAESVYSMDGDEVDLPALVALKNHHRVQLLLDEAHALGVLGPHGLGLSEATALSSQIDFQMGTLSKALGTSGGYLATDALHHRLLLHRARSFIYSTAPPALLAATARTALQLVRHDEGHHRRQALQDLIAHWQTLRPPTDSPPSRTPIIPIPIGDNHRALHISAQLLEQGLYLPAIRYPTVPLGTARLRLSLTADHTPADLEILHRALRQLDC